jgi:transcriptional regulator with XRE-family HTH domain
VARSKLAQLRHAKHWTLEEASEQIGVSANTLSRWEQGVQSPHGYNLHRLCDAYGITEGEFCDAYGITEGEFYDAHGSKKDYRKPELVLESDDEAVKRREATKTLGVLGLQFLGLSAWEQLSQTLMPSSAIDKTAIEALESVTKKFWLLSETMAPSALIHSVVGHFEMLVQLLRSMPPSGLYQSIASLAAEVAQIAARLFFDIKGYKEALTCYDLSVEFAHRANNQVLEVIGITRKARDMLQNGYTQDAYALLQQAPHLSSQVGSSVASAYLTAVAAKALSRLDETETCKQKLDESRQFVAKIQPGEDLYWTAFDASLLCDFQGDCYLQLHCFSEAQAVFQEAFTLSDSSSLRHQASITVGLADALMQQGELEQSCSLVSKALEFTAQCQSWMILHYILTFRKGVETWKNMPCVQSLDEQIAHVSTRMYQFDRSAISS